MRALALLALVLPLAAGPVAPPSSDWAAYGRDPGGSRHSPLTQIDRANVARLEVAWTFHTGEAGVTPKRGRPPALEATPLVVEGTMYLSTPLGRAIALDPADRPRALALRPRRGLRAGLRRLREPRRQLLARRARRRAAPCARAASSWPRSTRGWSRSTPAAAAPARTSASRGSSISGTASASPPFEFQAYEMTSPPAVVGDIVIAGSAIADNSRLAPASGEVRGFDARTGALRWTFDPIPQDARDPAYATWRDGSAGAHRRRERVVGDRGRSRARPRVPADVVARSRLLRRRCARATTATPTRSWPCAPRRGRSSGTSRPSTTTSGTTTTRRRPRSRPSSRTAAACRPSSRPPRRGMLFVLDRETGEPLFPVEERPVPRSTVAGEETPRRPSPSPR